MRRLEPRRRLSDNARGQRPGEDPRLSTAAPQNLQQVVPVHVLHGEKVRAVGEAHIEDRGHVGVVDQTGDPRLIHEHVDEGLLLGEVIVDLLDDQELLELCRALQSRQIQGGHATPRHLHDQLIPAYAVFVRHWCCNLIRALIPE